MNESQREHFSRTLSSAIKAMDIAVSASQIDALLEYLALFIKWNKAYNLSAIRDPEEMLSKHLLDSLAVVAHFARHPEVKRIIDVGTGGGLPGIPLAICFPQREFVLLDSAGKKMRFLYQVKQSLKLDKVTVENRRVETYRPETLFDVVISRAFASLHDMTHWCNHLLTPEGEFWAMKGVFPEEELRDLEKHYNVEGNFDLHVPGLVGERCLIVLKR